MKRTFTIVAVLLITLVGVSELSAQAAARGSRARQLVQHQVSIVSNVRGATVYINDEHRGSTPMKVVIDQGSYEIRIEAPGYRNYAMNASITESTTINATLTPLTYRLAIDANVRGAQVYVNGKLSSQVPLSLEVPEGQYSIRISASGYLDYDATVTVRGDENIRAVLQPAFATVRVEIPPQIVDRTQKDADRLVQVYVDGALQNGWTFQVTPGNHTIRFVSGGLAVEQAFSFNPAQTYVLRPHMELRFR